MFVEPKNLLVVYKEKDEVSLNQLKKLVDSNDDAEDGEIVGTEDGTVKIVSWSEKTWIDNKKAGNTGNLDDKILFLGDIKGVEKLRPTLDIKFDKYGVSYGFSGKQAAIMVDGKALLTKKVYDEFIEDLKKVCDASSVNEKKHFDFSDTKQKVMFVTVAVLFGAIGSITALTTYAFGDAKTVRNQQLLYGVAQLYLNDLSDFMKR
ncbi:MAG: hypothetical protein E7266_04635 [Lachnospiraceae bacterium]|nr:hypothetical protein [Lachnospiraceae bacterium]